LLYVQEENHLGFCFFSEVSSNRIITESAPVKKYVSKQQCFLIRFSIIPQLWAQGTAFGKEIDPGNPWNMSGKVFDASKSGVLSAIMEKEKSVINHQLP
jgi:hypothetical protein